MPKIIQMIKTSFGRLLSHCKPILQFYNVNYVSRTMCVCNNLGKPIILVRVSSYEFFRLTNSFVFLNTDGQQSFSFQPHPKARVEFFVKVLGES